MSKPVAGASTDIPNISVEQSSDSGKSQLRKNEPPASAQRQLHRNEGIGGALTPERKLSHGVGISKSNSMRVPRMTERRHTLPPRQESMDEVSSSGESYHSNLARSIKVVCVTAGAKDDLAIRLLKESCEKKKMPFVIIAYNEIAFDEVKATEQFLFADIAFVHLVSKEEESKLFLKIGHRRNYGKNVNVVLYQIPANVTEDQLLLTSLKELCLEAGAGLLPYYSLSGTSNSSNDMSLDLNNLVLLPSLRHPSGSGSGGANVGSAVNQNQAVAHPIEWTSLSHELRRVLNSFRQVANKDVALPIVTEIRDLMRSHKGCSLQMQLANVYQKLKLSRSQLTFETVHLFMMALRECQDYASMIEVFRYVREKNRELCLKEGLIYLYAFALNRRQHPGDREEALEVIETVGEPSADMLCLCGRIYKDLYIESEYQNEEYLYKAIKWYKKGADLEPSDYAMINLASLLWASGKSFDTDKDLKRLNNKLSYSIGSQGRLDQIGNYWVVATYFELCVLLDDKLQAVDAARSMFHLNAPAWYIKSTLHNLKLILSKRQELAKNASSPYSNANTPIGSIPHRQNRNMLGLPGQTYEESVKLFEFWMQFFLFVGEDSSKAFCDYPVLVIEQVTHATSTTAHRTYEFVPANLIIHRGPTSENVPGPIEEFDLLLLGSKFTNWHFSAQQLAAVNTYMNDGRCLLMYVNKLDDFQVYFPSEAHRDRLYETLKTELFPHKNPIAASHQHQIKNFEILKRPTGERAFLGAGAYGKVFKARDLDSGSLFALKEIDLQVGFSSDLQRPGGSGSGSLQVLRDEIQLHMRLKHQNIVKFLGHEIDTEASKFYIFMEFVDGGSLSNFLTSHYRAGLPDATAAQFTNQILDGIIYLHEHEVIHRDIKGANVLVDLQNRDFPVMKIADFGTSKQLSKISNLLNTNMKGTPNFLAPEVINCPRGYTYTADVWSLGCTVIEMISGRIPFHGVDPLFIIFQVGRGTVTPSVPENASKDAAEFIEKCCQTNPEDRVSPKELKMQAWILKNCRRSSACSGGKKTETGTPASGSSESVPERATANMHMHMHTSESSGNFSRNSSSATIMAMRSTSVPATEADVLNAERELQEAGDSHSKVHHWGKSDPSVEDPRTAPATEKEKKARKLNLKSTNSSSAGSTALEGGGGVAALMKSKTRARNKSGDSQPGDQLSSPNKSYKRRSLVDPQEVVRCTLHIFIQRNSEKILDLWIRNTQRVHCENRLELTSDELNILLMTFRDYLAADVPSYDILDRGLDRVLDLIADDNSAREILSSLRCFIDTTVILLKQGGDTPAEILKSEAVLAPMLEHMYDMLVMKKPQTLERPSSAEDESEDADDLRSAYERGTRENLAEIMEASDGQNLEDLGYSLDPDSSHSAIPRRNVNESSRPAQPRSLNAANQFSTGRHHAHHPLFSSSSRQVNVPVTSHSEPNSIASSGITGSLSGFSAHFLNMAQETGRLERQLAETQQTLNNLLQIQIQLNQSRISEAIRNIQSIGTADDKNPASSESMPGGPSYSQAYLSSLISRNTREAQGVTLSTEVTGEQHLTVDEVTHGSRLSRANACEISSPVAATGNWSIPSVETTISSAQTSTN